MNPALGALAICLAAAALEGLAAGRGVRERLAALRMPRWAPSFSVWVLVGALYYLVCFVVLYRLLLLPGSVLRSSALATVVVLMGTNAAFNLLFFRRSNLRASFLLFLPYSIVALFLAAQLALLDRPAAAVFGPYLLYFVYATVWGYQVWRLNSGAHAVP